MTTIDQNRQDARFEPRFASPVFAETRRGVEAAGAAAADATTRAGDAERAKAWRAIVAANLL